MTKSLFIFGLGYSGRAIARAAIAAGIQTTATSRNPSAQTPIPSLTLIPFTAAAPAIAAATHLITTAAPDESGDPILNAYAPEIAAAPNLHYLGYLSTTGVYGNHNGAWVDEDTPPTPESPRAQRRLAAETAWRQIATAPPVMASPPSVIASEAKQSIFPSPSTAQPKTLDIFRLAGIYGPGRSALDDVRARTARRILKPGHAFGRIHVEDIAHGVLAALARPLTHTTTILNFTDDAPTPSADVIAEAARLLDLPPPPELPFEAAAKTMSPMALSFWSENRRVSNLKTKSLLHLTWRYPTYREGLAAILKQTDL